MAGPITWRNVVGASPAEALRPLAYAQQSMNTAFSGLEGILSKREALDAANYQTVKENNTQAFLDAVASKRSPEELAAAQASGELDALRAGFGGQINLAATRGAADARTTALYNQANAANTFNDTIQARADAPIRDEIAMLYNNGQVDAAQKLLDSNPQLKDRASLAQGIEGTRRSQVSQNREDLRFQSELDKNARDIVSFNTNQTAAKTRAELDALNIDEAKLKATDTKEVRTAQDYVTDAAQRRLNMEAEVKPKLQELAKAVGAPVDAQGLPDLERMTDEQRKKMIDGAKELGLSTVETDAQFRQNVQKELSKLGISGRAVTAATTNNPNFNSMPQLSEEDNQQLKMMDAAIAAKKADAAKSNPFLIKDPDLYGTRDSVIGLVDNLIKDGTGTRDRIKKTVDNILNTPITIKDPSGKEQSIPVPPALVAMALRASADTDSAVWNSTSGNLEERVKALTSNQEFLDKYKASLYVETGANEELKKERRRIFNQAGVSERSVGTLSNIVDQLINSRSK